MNYLDPKPCTKCGNLISVHAFMGARQCYKCWNVDSLTPEEVIYWSSPAELQTPVIPKEISKPVYKETNYPIKSRCLDVYFPGDEFPSTVKAGIEDNSAYRQFFSAIRKKAGILRV